jgi:hypothetical protein
MMAAGRFRVDPPIVVDPGSSASRSVPRMPLAYDELEFGFSWIEQPLLRTCHALATAEGVWLVDPVDEREPLARAAGLGAPAGVLQLLDRHKRDCAAIADRLGVAHLVVPDAVPGSPFEVIRVVRRPGWRESALWWPEQRALVVPEALGTTPHFTLGRAPVGVHPVIRLLPPTALRGYAPEHLLVGHGKGVHGPDAAAGLEHALESSRRGAPEGLARLAWMLVGQATSFATRSRAR